MRAWQWFALAGAVLAGWWYVTRMDSAAPAAGAATMPDYAPPPAAIPTTPEPAIYTPVVQARSAGGLSFLTPPKPLNLPPADPATAPARVIQLFGDGGGFAAVLKRAQATNGLPAPSAATAPAQTTTDSPSFPPTSTNPATSFSTFARQNPRGGIL